MSVYSNHAASSREEIAAYVGAVLDLVGVQDPTSVLADTPAKLEHVLASVSGPAVMVPEAPGKWSIRDVLQHFADSELVAGYRLRMILAQDRPALQGYDQDLWVDRLHYDEVTAREAVDQFVALRRANMRLWRRLGPEELTRVGVHGERGEESLDHLRRLYAGHDLLHLNQLHRIRAVVI